MKINNNITPTTKKLDVGLLLKNMTKTSLPPKPLISVITVVFNAVDLLDNTIQSVINQTYDNIEYIIIDGGSTDGTLDIIRNYENCIDYWVSEPDAGIYDAMNKGVEKACGQWAIFMNAGDWFNSTSVLQEVFLTGSTENFDAIYGRHNVQFEDGLVASGQAKSIDLFWQGMIASHQSIFVATKILKNNKFNIANKIVADFELLYGLYINGGRFHGVETVVSCVSAQGLCDSNRLSVISANWRVINSYQRNIFHSLYYMLKLLESFLLSVVKKFLPMVLIRHFRMFRSRKWHRAMLKKADTNAD